MKTKLLLVLLCGLILCACDNNKGKIEDAAKRFINAVNLGDKVTIYDLYPKAKNLTNMTLPDSIQQGEISVEKNEEGNFIVTINNTRQQQLEYILKGEDQFVLNKTYGILELDSSTQELAIKTGVPLKKISDIRLSEILGEDGDFMSYLEEEYSYEINGNLTTEGGQYEWNYNYGGNVTVHQPIRNIGNSPISGEEYNVEFNFYSPSGAAASLKQVEAGVDLEPGEGYTITMYPGSAYVRVCANHDFSWTTSFVYKNQSTLDNLLKNVSFTGKEYAEFKKWEKEQEAEAAAEAVEEAPAAEQEQTLKPGYQSGYITDPVDDYVNVREGPGTNYSILSTLDIDDEVYYTQGNGNWRQVYDTDYNYLGYVYYDRIRK